MLDFEALAVADRDHAAAVVDQSPGDQLVLGHRDTGSPHPKRPREALLSRYAQLLAGHIARRSACNRAHHIDARCSRWLLATHDCVAGNEFPMTHEVRAGRPVDHIHRPHSGMSSIAGSLDRDASIELAAIGSDGVIGVFQALGDRLATEQSIVLLSGEATRIRFGALRAELERDRELRAAQEDVVHSQKAVYYIS